MSEPQLPQGLEEPGISREESAPARARAERAAVEFVARIESRHGPWAAALLVALGAELLAFFFAATWTTEAMGRFTNLVEANPFAPGTADVFHVHRHRILGPAIAWLLGLGGVWGTLVPIVASIPLLALVFRYFRARTSVAAAILGTTLMATTHLTMTSRTLLGYQDSLVFLFAMVALVSPRFLIAGPALFLAMYGDQRAMMIVPFIMAWHFLEDSESAGRLWRNLRLAVSYAGVIGLWVVSAALLSLYWGDAAETGTEFWEYLTGVWHQVRPGAVHLSLFMAFKAAWLLLPLGLWVCWQRREWWPALLISGASLLIIGMGLLVGDFSRATAHCFPALLMGAVLYWRVDRSACEQLLRVCLLINLISPFYQGMAQGLWIYYRPLPAEVLFRVLGG